MRILCETCICKDCINNECWARRCIGFCNCEKDPKPRFTCKMFENFLNI